MRLHFNVVLTVQSAGPHLQLVQAPLADHYEKVIHEALAHPVVGLSLAGASVEGVTVKHDPPPEKAASFDYGVQGL